MLSKTQVKYIQSLFLKKFRDEYGLFILEGPKMANEAIALSPEDIINIYACSDWIELNSGFHSDLTQKFIEVSAIEMEKISALHTPSNVLVVLRQPISRGPSSWSGISLLLDGIQDPGNLGSIIRTADWFGVQYLICGTGTADCYNSKVVQSTMGSILRVKFLYQELNSFLLENPDVPILASSLDGSPLSREDKWDTLFVAIGNESQGLQQSILKKASRTIRIPGSGRAESLNAAVATGIILYELTI